MQTQLHSQLSWAVSTMTALFYWSCWILKQDLKTLGSATWHTLNLWKEKSLLAVLSPDSLWSLQYQLFNQAHVCLQLSLQLCLSSDSCDYLTPSCRWGCITSCSRWGCTAGAPVLATQLHCTTDSNALIDMHRYSEEKPIPQDKDTSLVQRNIVHNNTELPSVCPWQDVVLWRMYSGNLSLFAVTFYFWHLEICQSFSHVKVCVCVCDHFSDHFSLVILLLMSFSCFASGSASFLIHFISRFCSFCAFCTFFHSTLCPRSTAFICLICYHFLASFFICFFFVIYRHPWTFIVTKGDVSSVVEDTAVYQGRNLFFFFFKKNLTLPLAWF